MFLKEGDGKRGSSSSGPARLFTTRQVIVAASADDKGQIGLCFWGTISWLANLKRFSAGYLYFCLVARGAEVDLKGGCVVPVEGMWLIGPIEKRGPKLT